MELPYEGWYNGNIAKMVEKRTYPQYRRAILEMYESNVKWKAMTKEEAEQAMRENDELWAKNNPIEPSEPKVAKRQYRRRKST